MTLHIGRLIKEELRRQERSIVWFAEKLSCDRTNVYKIFARTSIDTQLLLRISIILNRNFFAVYTRYFEEQDIENRVEV